RTGGGATATGGFAASRCSVRMRAITSSVSPTSSSSIHVRAFGSLSITDARSTTPSIATTSWFGSSRPSTISPPLWTSNGTFIDSRRPLRSLRVVNTSTCSHVEQRTCSVRPVGATLLRLLRRIGDELDVPRQYRLLLRRIDRRTRIVVAPVVRLDVDDLR